MSKSKQRVVVVCPGRGTYNAPEWGYLKHHHVDKGSLLESFDDYRRLHQQPTLTELDGEKAYSLKLHSRGGHVSSLIYACSYADFLDIDQDRYEIVAVTGNSMGWYTSLAIAGALDAQKGLHLVNSMGRLMQECLIGGQLLMPWVDDDWRPDWDARARYLAVAENICQSGEGRAYLSIDLGGMLVFGADAPGIAALNRELPKKDKFPIGLLNHAAFHTPLQESVREIAKESLGPELFNSPKIPLIDGRGHIWSPWSTDPHSLRDYTLSHQLTQTYDFSAALRVAIREFAPDKLIILGPGTTLGGAVAQSLILCNWQDLNSRSAFKKRQENNPLVVSMGMSGQRPLVLRQR
jgi:acyl transferase domain-containing protein